MGFWCFMLAMALLIPLTMIGFGAYFRRGGPKNVNGAFGYRTPMSTKNAETWAFAHRYCGRLWFAGGWILLPLSVAVMLFTLGHGENAVSAVGSTVEILQILALIGTIFPTERALKRSFDRDGNRR